MRMRGSRLSLHARASSPDPRGLFDLLQHAVALSRETGGAYDVTSGALSEAWGFVRGPKRVPDPETLTEARARTGWQHLHLDPERLVVEVTETAVFEGGTAVDTLQTLVGLGVKVALDDFGTGHSSLGLLRTCPADTLKVDKSFIARLRETSEQVQTIALHPVEVRLARYLLSRLPPDRECDGAARTGVTGGDTTTIEPSCTRLVRPAT